MAPKPTPKDAKRFLNDRYALVVSGIGVLCLGIYTLVFTVRCYDVQGYSLAKHLKEYFTLTMDVVSMQYPETLLVGLMLCTIFAFVMATSFLVVFVTQEVRNRKIYRYVMRELMDSVS